MHKPTTVHMKMVERILAYLKGSPGKGIWKKKNSSSEILGYCDADWAGDHQDRKSTTGYCTFVGGNMVTWKSKKQRVVSRSSAEAEYRSIAVTTCELIWLKALLKDLGYHTNQPMKLYCDNKAALHIASNPVFHERTKHIEVDCHFIREKIQDRTISTQHVRSEDQLADIFTKNLTSALCISNSVKIGLIDIHQPILRGNVENEVKLARFTKGSPRRT